MRGVGAGAGVAGGHDEDVDYAILMSSQEVLDLCDEAERQAAAAAAEKQAAALLLLLLVLVQLAVCVAAPLLAGARSATARPRKKPLATVVATLPPSLTSVASPRCS